MHEDFATIVIDSQSRTIHCVSYITGRLIPILMRSSCNNLLSFLLLAVGAAGVANARVTPVPVPQEMRSTDFTVAVNGKPVDVAHAAATYDYVSVDATGPVKISITAAEDGFWDAGVDIQPWRLGIRPKRTGRTIEFELKEPAKLAISRPGDFLNHARMLFFFVGQPPAPPAKDAGDSYHIVAPGVHRESINPKSGETWYLAPGAVVFGSINLFQVDHVKVLGRGVIVYQGTQNPNDDDGWMQKPDWHCIGAKDAHNIEIHGLTCLVRSRTWSIQMKDSSDFVYDDIRVMGGNPGNANQDGMDWLGSGDTVVRNSFFRASDDVFSMVGNWDGYTHEAMVAPGKEVSNVLVEHSVLSTSISNIVRAGWPQKTFNSHNFTLRDSDVLHSGIGSCGLPFALFTFWGAQGAKGDHTGYTFENLWLDDWYSLFQMEQEEPGLHGFTFRNLWSLDQPSLVPSLLKGDVKDVRIENVKVGQNVVSSDADLPVSVESGATEPTYAPGDSAVRAVFRVTPEVLQPGTRATFEADPAASPDAKYTWLFGDGTTAHGRRVKHRFADAMGTELDGKDAGSFRVLLHVEDAQQHQDWASQLVPVVAQFEPAAAQAAAKPGLQWQGKSGDWLGKSSGDASVIKGLAVNLAHEKPVGMATFTEDYDGFLDVPKDGGYNFTLLDRDGARLSIDGKLVAQTGDQFPEVCGSKRNAMRIARVTVGLRAGKHILKLEALEGASQQAPRLLWEGPGIRLTDVPAAAFSHE